MIFVSHFIFYFVPAWIEDWGGMKIRNPSAEPASAPQLSPTGEGVSISAAGKELRPGPEEGCVANPGFEIQDPEKRE